MAKKPQRSDFGRGLKGDRMYQNALAAYNRAASGKLSATDKLFSMSEEAKAARRRIVKSALGLSKPGVGLGTNRVRPTTPYYGPGGDPSGSGQGQAQQKSKPKPKPKPKPQPAAAKPKPKPQPPATLSAAEKKKRAEAAAKKKADAAAMKAELLKIRKAELAAERQKAYNKSMEQAKKNRARGQRRGGPRD